MAITLKQRAYAGLWFMAAGAIPALFLGSAFLSAAPPDHAREFVTWFLLSPLLVAGLMGFLLGARILDVQKVRSGWRAALQGLIVAVAAFLLSAIIISTWDSYTNEYGSFVQMLFMTLVIGSMLVGWVAAIAGVLAGWLLYQLRAYRRIKPVTSDSA